MNLALVLDHGFNLPMFPNLVKLVIAWADNFLPVLLNNLPNLEHLTFSNGLLYFAKKWNLPTMDSLVCLRSKMKEILLLNEEIVNWQEAAMIRYLLKHSYILKNWQCMHVILILSGACSS